MSFEFINPDTLPNSKTYSDKPTISFYKAGIVALNTAATKMLKLKKDSQIQFIVDQEDSTVWYLHVLSENKRLSGYTCRDEAFERKRRFEIGNMKLYKYFCECMTYEPDQTYYVNVSEATTEIQGFKTHKLEFPDYE